jgi:hypothetical protein
MPERHLTLLMPQNVDGPADIEFEMKGPAGARGAAPPAPTR